MSKLVFYLTPYLALLGPLLMLVGGFTLWRTRRRERLWSLAGSVVVVLGVAFTALGWLGVSTFAPVLGPVNRLVERVSGETPQAKVSSYLALVMRGAQDEALALWPANEQLGSEYEERRHSVTTTLEELGPELSHRVLKIEWWSTCCEPHIITDSRYAGFARLWVEVTGSNESRQYVFDLLVRGGSYWGEMEGYPVRHWQIVDVYPAREKPLWWRWPFDQ
ncbi:MAG TPA: hypothetical protein DCP08_04480 [Chloroflexi bacterium]|nr:hypothetical protein [Chloroflexota bacterium]